MNEYESSEKLLRALACFGCNYADGCNMEWTRGHCHCEEMMSNARAFAEKNSIRIVENEI